MAVEGTSDILRNTNVSYVPFQADEALGGYATHMSSKVNQESHPVAEVRYDE